MLWGDGTPTREFLYVDDCVDGLALAAERYDGREPVNLGTGDEISIRDLAELVADVTGFEGGSSGTLDAERAAAPRPRREPRARALRLAGDDAAPRRARAHRRLVPVATHGACRRLRPRSRGSCRRCPTTGGGLGADRAGHLARRRRPLVSLAVLAVVQWLAILVFALTVRHNGWLFYQGGDQIWLLTTGWLLGQGDLGADLHRLRLAARGRSDHGCTGPSFVNAMPPVIALQRARARPARAVGDLRPRDADRGARVRPPGRGGLGGAALRRDPALARRLPRALRRAVPPGRARSDRARRLPVDGAPARRRPALHAGARDPRCPRRRRGRARGRLRGRRQAVERALRRRPGRRRPARAKPAAAAAVRARLAAGAADARGLEAARARHAAGVRARGDPARRGAASP